MFPPFLRRTLSAVRPLIKAPALRRCAVFWITLARTRAGSPLAGPMSMPAFLCPRVPAVPAHRQRRRACPAWACSFFLCLVHGSWIRVVMWPPSRLICLSLFLFLSMLHGIGAFLGSASRQHASASRSLASSPPVKSNNDATTHDDGRVGDLNKCKLRTTELQKRKKRRGNLRCGEKGESALSAPV